MVGNSNSGRREDPAKRKSVDAAGDPIAPDWLSDEAREKFEETWPLIKFDVGLGEIDSDVLAIYSDAYVQYAKVATKRDPSYRAERKQLFDQMMKCLTQLGMSPKSRQALPSKPGKKKDPFSVYDGEDEGAA